MSKYTFAGDLVSSLVYSKKVALLAAAGLGLGYATYLTWKNWDDIKSTLLPAYSVKSTNCGKPLKQCSEILKMGQQISSNGNGADYRESVSVDEDVENGNLSLNPSFYENESLLNGELIKFKQHSPSRSSSVSPTENSTSTSTYNQHSFKKVVVRSRFSENDGTHRLFTEIPTRVVDKQPVSMISQNNYLKVESSSLAGNSNGAVENFRKIDITSKVRGFSHVEYQNSLQHKLNSLYGTNKLISNEDAKCLVLLLQQKSDETLLKTVTTMCNLAAFTVNQDLLRQNGAVEILVELLHDCSVSDSVRLMLTQCIGNMAVNVKNHPLLQRCVPKIVALFVAGDCSELQKIMCVQALTNLSVEISSQNAVHFVPAIKVVLERLWSYTNGANVSSLKLLVNFSCSATLSHQVLASEAPENLLDVLSLGCSEEALIRSTTMFCHLCSTVDALNLKLTDFQPTSNATPVGKSVFFAIFIESGGNSFKNVIETLLSHKNEEILQKSNRILIHLKNFKDELVFQNAVDKLVITDTRLVGPGISLN